MLRRSAKIHVVNRHCGKLLSLPRHGGEIRDLRAESRLRLAGRGGGGQNRVADKIRLADMAQLHRLIGADGHIAVDSAEGKPERPSPYHLLTIAERRHESATR